MFEITSDSSLETDLIVKNREYRATPSVQRYVILQQTYAGAMVFARRGPDWISELADGAEAVLDLPELGITIPLTELYADLDLSSPAEPGSP